MKNDSEPQTDALRSDIDETRQRMDQTIDDLGDRLKPRHLFDEFLGYLRGENGEGDSRMQAMREKISQGASQAAHSVVQTIKENPLPALLIGAGVAWMIYESRRDKSPRRSPYAAEIEYDPDLHYDRPLEYPPGYSAEDQMEFEPGGESKLGQPKEKAGEVAGHAKEKVAEFGEKTREKLASVKERAGEKLHAARDRAVEMGARVKEKAGAAYTRTRERVATTADEHPLEVGLCCLAAGLIAGLALPTPARVDRAVGPTAARLRQRARTAGSEVLEKGRRVARAAADAAKSEADAQGLTPEHLRQSAQSVVERAGEAASETARNEGLAPAGAPPEKPAAPDSAPRSGSSE